MVVVVGIFAVAYYLMCISGIFHLFGGLDLYETRSIGKFNKEVKMIGFDINVRIAELEMENAALKKKIAELESKGSPLGHDDPRRANSGKGYIFRGKDFNRPFY